MHQTDIANSKMCVFGVWGYSKDLFAITLLTKYLTSHKMLSLLSIFLAFIHSHVPHLLHFHYCLHFHLSPQLHCLTNLCRAWYTSGDIEQLLPPLLKHQLPILLLTLPLSHFINQPVRSTHLLDISFFPRSSFLHSRILPLGHPS